MDHDLIVPAASKCTLGFARLVSAGAQTDLFPKNACLLSEVYLQPDPRAMPQTLSVIILPPLPARRSLQQWKLSPLHTSLSVSGVWAGAKTLRAFVEMRRVRAGRGS